MRFLMAIIDAIIGFVQRNPLTVLIILFLGLTAPALLKGIATVVLYVILGLLLLGLLLVVIFTLRIRAAKRQMEEQFSQHFGSDGAFRAGSRQEFRSQERPDAAHEGEVHVYQTSDAREKRISKDVGDYVDFEETKNE